MHCIKLRSARDTPPGKEKPILRHYFVPFLALLCVSPGFPACGTAQSIAVRQSQGTSRAFLLIRDQDSKVIGRGEFSQTAHGTRVSSSLTLHFRDGSMDQETSSFSQGSTLRLLADHHVQTGPSFPKQLDMTVDAQGNVTEITTQDGKSKTETKKVQLPSDVTNGIIGAALLNLPPSLERSFSYVAPNSKGRIIQLRVTPDRTDTFTIANMVVKADVYRIHYELGGLTGVIAPIVGKQPADTFVWVTSGVPSLVREQAALYEGGPVLSLELAGATFARDRDSGK